MKKLPASELLRRACLLAETVADDPEFRAQLRAYRRKRWGVSEEERALDATRPVDPREAAGMPDQVFEFGPRGKGR